MSQRLPLQKSAQATIGANGSATVALGPTAYNEMWSTSVVGVRCTSNVKEPTCRLYLGPANDSNFIGGTYSGSQDADTSLNVNIPGGLQLTAVWTGGVPGAIVTLNVFGSTTIG